MDDSPLVARVKESNRQARNAEARWAPHRARVMAVLDGIEHGGGRLALLGAGHLHDVDLAALCRRYASIVLADLDAGPPAGALRRAGPAVAAPCTVHAPVDLTGVLDLLEEAARRPDGPALLMARLSSHRCEVEAAPFDVTVSLGALTQLMQSVIDAGVAPSHLNDLLLAVRDKHLRDLVRLTRPGGTVVLVTDFVASTTAPHLVDVPEEALEPALRQLIEARNFFTGTNPYRLLAILEDAPAFRTRIASARFVGPWWWRITTDRQHLAGAIVAERRPPG